MRRENRESFWGWREVCAGRVTLSRTMNVPPCGCPSELWLVATGLFPSSRLLGSYPRLDRFAIPHPNLKLRSHDGNPETEASLAGLS